MVSPRHNISYAIEVTDEATGPVYKGELMSPSILLKGQLTEHAVRHQVSSQTNVI